MPCKSIFKGCSCAYCRGSKQIASRKGHSVVAAKKLAHRKFRRTGKNITEDSVMPSFVSVDRWS